MLLIGMAAAVLLNYSFIEPLLIPEPCYYHGREAGFLFNLFYDTPSFAGGHPVPTVLNGISTVAAGGVAGWKATALFQRKNRIPVEVTKNC
jgi:hypothetical protein